MVYLPAFFSKAEEKEIGQLGRLFFKGVNPAEEKELKKAWYKWYYFFDLFLMIADRENGNLLHLPFSGSPPLQPYKSFKIIQFIQTLYFERLKEEYEKIKR